MRRPLMKTVVNELVPSDLKRRAFFMLEESLTPIAQGERRDARAAGKALYLKLTDEGASAAGGVEAGVLRSGTCRSGDLSCVAPLGHGTPLPHHFRTT